MGDTHKVGIVGLGVISKFYLETLVGNPQVTIAAVADLDEARAAEIAATIPGCRALTVDALMAEREIRTVLNLTVPAAHAEIERKAIAAGKDVFTEKPLTSTLGEARDILVTATAEGRRVGCAPDTVLGTGIQTARAAIERGTIGRVSSANATWVAPGHERWHPNPDFYYLPGGGPALDMGPYYITSLLHLLGPVESVIGATSRARDTRTILSGPRAGETIPVGVATHVSGVLTHVSGALSTVTLSFDGSLSSAAPIEVHGDNGSLQVPDPNVFTGDVLFTTPEREPWQVIEPSAGYEDGARGVGLLDFLAGPGRASGDIALHVLEILESLLASGDSGQRIPMQSRPTVPALVPFTPKSEWSGA